MVQAGAPGPVRVGGEGVTSGGPPQCLVAPCSLIGQKWPRQACDPTAGKGLCPNATSFPTHLLPECLLLCTWVLEAFSPGEWQAGLAVK